jgi:hypothetical protein
MRAGTGRARTLVTQIAERILAMMLVRPIDLYAFRFGNSNVLWVYHCGFTLSMSRTPEIRRIAVTIRSSCFLSFTSIVISIIAPAVW